MTTTTMTGSESSGRAARRPLFAAAVALALLAAGFVGPIVLHFLQRAHNELPLVVETAFPPDAPVPPGKVFATTLAALIDHELDSGFGWRPNDLFFWGPGLFADNNSNRQLGIIQAARESARVMRDNLTKVSATEFDKNLVEADTKLRNDEYKFWFPAAETRFSEATDALRRYVAGLESDPPTSKPLNRRNVELIRLFQTWTDLLGSAHANLYEDDVSIFTTDDDFYRAQGLAHVMSHLTRAVRREYASELRERATVLELIDQVERSLHRAATLKPLIVLDSSAEGIFANHRRNLDAFIVDARQLMYSIRDELEK